MMHASKEGNKMKTVLFLHGMESKPGGSKAKYLEAKGYKVLNPHLPKSSFEESIRISQELVGAESPDVIVGSSRGAAVGMCLDTGVPMVLIAPAWRHFKHSEDKEISARCVVLHSEADDIVKYEDSITICNSSGATLIKVGENHRMSDSDALEAILDAVRYVTR